MRAMSGEIEIGRSKRARQAYSFDDIAVVPARRTRDVRDVRVSWQLDAYHVDLPVMASPMDSVMSPETAILVGRLGGIGVLDLEGLWARYEDPADALDRIRTASCEDATRVLQEVYRAPVRPELIAARLAQIREAGVVVAGRLGPAQTASICSSSAARWSPPSTSRAIPSPSISSASSMSWTCPSSSAG